MTRKQAIQGTKLSEAALQRIETGSLNFRNVGDLKKLLAKYGVDDEEVIEAFLDLNRDAINQDWVTQYRSQVHPAMQGFVGLEAEAEEIRAYHPQVIHGLIQTKGYAQAIFEDERPLQETTSEFIQYNVALRLERKERVLRREPKPVKLWVIQGEAGLRSTYGGADVMREQYEEITRLSKLSHVKIQVLPLNSPGYRATNDLAILDLGAGLPPMVSVDNPWGAVSTSDKPGEVARFTRRFDYMIASALPPEDTPQFMKRLAGEL
ncbi:DUF5753 domain-containing protein [Streptomyces sp. NPDC091292]|uniref:DUF5753 domain-containing protein n=1 Tax=Streptomyces sp. NPDC091292 TaxID=3365991 RepID=UPI00381D2EAB